MPYVPPERYVEFREVLARLGPSPADWIVDIGSEVSLFPQLLARRFACRVVCVDPFADVRFQRDYAGALGLADRVAICRASGTDLPVRREAAAAITCISVLEHIPGDGDTETLAAAARAVAAGGAIVITVPWQRYYYEYYGTEPLYANDDPDRMKLLTRFYDQTSFRRRLVEPAGLRILDQAVFAEPRGLSATARLLTRCRLRGFSELAQSRAYRRIPAGGEERHRRYVCVALLARD
jgi:hypothetical protein